MQQSSCGLLLRSLLRSQVRVLAVRNCRWYLRNPELMLAKLFTYIFMGAFMGAPLLVLMSKTGCPQIVISAESFAQASV